MPEKEPTPRPDSPAGNHTAGELQEHLADTVPYHPADRTQAAAARNSAPGHDRLDAAPPPTTTPPRAAPGSSHWTTPAPGPHPSRTTPPPSALATGTAEQLLLFVWGRLTLNDLKTEGDQQVFEQLIAWEPEE
ncbi:MULTISPECIES: hypothetical protein [unclassified Streptomyces]|uniref:hypothetical protein n=1 Tax=unclassified Streptomyces TaxID=2593676 RepID=UPI0036C14676